MVVGVRIARVGRAGRLTSLAVGAAAVLVAGCGVGGDPSAATATGNAPSDKGRRFIEERGQVRDLFFGDGRIFGGGGQQASGGGAPAIGVNSFLWRASLDTVSFMPLASADPFGGVILTDWYTPGDATGERFKVNVFILDRQLRADAIRVAAFRQVRDPSGAWIDAQLGPETAPALEEAILGRARELRLQGGVEG